jgi:hypothetical protein
MLKGIIGSKCALSDTQALNTYFQGVMGVMPPSMQLTAGDEGILRALYTACRRDPALFDLLNAKMSFFRGPRIDWFCARESMASWVA